MLLMILAWQVILAFDALLANSQDNLVLVVSAIALISGWLGWRIWKFTVLPQIYPDDPQELPYCIPSKSIKNINHHSFFLHFNSVISSVFSKRNTFANTLLSFG